MEDKLTEDFASNEVVIQEGKTTAIVAYITIIGLIAAFVMNNEKKNLFASFHIRQMLGLTLTGLVLSMVNIIPFFGWIVSIVGSILLLVLWVIGLMNAVNGKEKEVPVLGKYYSEWFKGI